MNCLEFRRHMLTDPLRLDDEAHAHESACEACAAFARDTRAREVRLHAVLNDVSPPEGMAERIHLAMRFEHRAEVRRRWWYGAAAGVLLAIGVSMVSVWTTAIERADLALAQSVLHHIEDEASHLHEAHPVAAGRVGRVFARFNAELAGDIGPVHFAAECLMRERNGIHLVLPGKKGAITVFLMPGEMTDSVLPIRSARFHGRILPTPWGSVAVIGESGEELDGIGERVASATRWKDGPVIGSAISRVGLVEPVGAAQQQDS